MLELLNCLIIKPLYYIFEFAFDNIYDASGNIFLSIILMSFIVFVFCLPLYLKADEFQKKEKEIQKKLSDKINAIKRNYYGDERLFLLQTLYKQNNYNPLMGLRLSLNLLLQIPFFIAAYLFFKELIIFDGVHLGFIKDLMKPDGIIIINHQFHINVLPILMTIVNIFAGYVYVKSENKNKNITLMLSSFIFLVLLYNAPAILVLYWLFNNVFYLIKNILLNFISHEKLLKYVFITAFIVYSIFTLMYKLPYYIPIVILIILFVLNIEAVKKIKFDFDYKSLFITGIFSLWILLGLLIPSNVISTSPSEFIFTDIGPFKIILYVACIIAGLFLFWGSCIYNFLNVKLKKIFSIFLCFLFFTSLINLFYLKIPDATLTNTMMFEIGVVNFSQPSSQLAIYGLILTIIFGVLTLLIVKKRMKIINIIMIIVCLTNMMLIADNFIKIRNDIKEYLRNQKEIHYTKGDKYVHLSKNGKNVLIIFVDRAINSFLPLIFHEKPDLYKQFSGFTYYPNTYSYASYTIIGYLPILGGYEYTPFEMDKREGIFEDKYKEAITMLPALFSNNNYQTSIINSVESEWIREDKEDVTKEDINTISEANFYKKYNISQSEIPMNIIDDFTNNINLDESQITKRNLIYYAFLSTSFPFIRAYIYDDGIYHNPSDIITSKYGRHFLKNYTELYKLPELTELSSTKNTFTVFNNNLTHSPAILNYPNYNIVNDSIRKINIPKWPADNIFALSHYHVNAAMIRLLGNYFDFLRKNNVYNNTRIIIVADHGFALDLPYVEDFEMYYFLSHNPLLLVKDFNQNGEINIDTKTMTNADVPYIASKDIIAHPKNPFTNKPIICKNNENGVIIKYDSGWQPKYYLRKRKVLNENDTFLYIKGDPLNYKNWKAGLNYKESLDIYNKINN